MATKQQLVELNTEEQETVKRVLSERYGLDAPLRMRRNTVGVVNRTFILEYADRKLVLRESEPQTDEAHLRLEIEALHFLASRGCTFVADVLPSREGDYFVRQEGRFYTLQTFLPGEIRASWNDLGHFDGEMLSSYFRLLAHFARAAESFSPQSQCPNFPVSYYTANGARLFSTLLETYPSSEGRDLLASKRDAVADTIRRAGEGLNAIGYDKLPRQFVHFDFHPGNVHFLNGEAVALFDLDWAQFDSRFVDLAAAISMSCGYYGGPNHGRYIPEKIARGLSAYRDAYGRSEFSPAAEHDMLAALLPAYTLFQFLWAVEWYPQHHKETESMAVLLDFFNLFMLPDFRALFAA